MGECKMNYSEIALQLTAAAITAGAIEFEKEGGEEKINKANIEKILKFYNEMVNTINDKTSNFGAQVF